MICKRCKVKMPCKESRSILDGRQRIRAYVCQICSSRYYTIEKMITPMDYSEYHKLRYRGGGMHG